MEALFFLLLCIGAFGLILVVASQITSFGWLAALRRLRFSLITLLAATSIVGVALGINRLQQQVDPVFSFPFPVILLSCFLVFGLWFEAQVTWSLQFIP